MMNNEKQLQGSVMGGVLLIAGCCIGAGMLGLPIRTGIAGFQPSLVMFFLSWVFMASTGLMVLEVNLWFPKGVNLLTMAEGTLGKIGKAFVWVLFAFLFYSLMVAYVSGSSQLLNDFLGSSSWISGVTVLLLFSLFLYYGTGVVDLFNRVLMFGLIVTYLMLITLGIPHVNLEYFTHAEWAAAPFVVPAMVISFGYHNLIPTLRSYLGGDVSRLRQTIVIGSSVPLLVYLIWEFVILGLIPVDGGFSEALEKGEMATAALRRVVGSSWVVVLVEFFAFFAIVTSLLGVALSFVDFLADGLRVQKDRIGKVILCFLTLFPPFLFSVIYPNAFLEALNAAGAYGAVTLFGVIPALMLWVGRYKQKQPSPRLLPGGKLFIAAIIAVALMIMISEIVR